MNSVTVYEKTNPYIHTKIIFRSECSEALWNYLESSCKAKRVIYADYIILYQFYLDEDYQPVEDFCKMLDIQIIQHEVQDFRWSNRIDTEKQLIKDTYLDKEKDIWEYPLRVIR